MRLEQYELGNIEDWSSLVLVRVYREEQYKNGDDEARVKRVSCGFVFAIDPKFGARAQWKLAGGHKVDGESPLDTAVRELIGETNLSPKLCEFRYEGKWLGPRKDHWKILFSTNIHEHELGWMNSNHPENGGERPEHFNMDRLASIVRDGKFMLEHLGKLIEFGLVLPGPELEAFVRQRV